MTRGTNKNENKIVIVTVMQTERKIVAKVGAGQTK